MDQSSVLFPNAPCHCQTVPLCLAVSLSGPKLPIGHSQFVKIPTCNEANLVNNESGIIAVQGFKVPVTVDCSFPAPESLSQFIFISTIN